MISKTIFTVEMGFGSEGYVVLKPNQSSFHKQTFVMRVRMLPLLASCPSECPTGKIERAHWHRSSARHGMMCRMGIVAKAVEKQKEFNAEKAVCGANAPWTLMDRVITEDKVALRVDQIRKLVVSAAAGKSKMEEDHFRRQLEVMQMCCEWLNVVRNAGEDQMSLVGLQLAGKVCV